MTRRSVPVFLSMMLLGPLLLAAAAAGAEDLSVAKSHEEKVRITKNDEGRIAVTRSDGSTGHTKSPDQKEIRKLVGYIRDGMNRADRSDQQKQTKRAIQNRRIWIRK